MKTTMLFIVTLLSSIRLLPLICLFYFSSNRKQLLIERDRWYEIIFPNKKKGFYLFLRMLKLAEYRSVLYYRLGNISLFVKWLAKEQYALNFGTPSALIGGGLVIQHGHSTEINAASIGRNCQIWHNVTIGVNKSHTDNKPNIGNNVKICAGSIVLGKIDIGDNVIIGAGSVVVKNIPDNCIVVGNPAKIIRTIQA